jgi:hypothetical protein
MNKIKAILLFLSLLFVINKIEAQQPYGVMSDSTVINFIEDEIIAEYDYMKILTNYRDSTYKRNLKVYQEAGMYVVKLVNACSILEGEMEMTGEHLRYLEYEILEQDERIRDLIKDLRSRLVELTLEKYKYKICREKKLKCILEKDNIIHADKEVIDVTKDFISLLQDEKEEVKKMFESVMQPSKSRFKRVVYKERNIISLQKYKGSVGSIKIE